MSSNRVLKALVFVFILLFVFIYVLHHLKAASRVQWTRSLLMKPRPSRRLKVHTSEGGRWGSAWGRIGAWLRRPGSSASPLVKDVVIVGGSFGGWTVAKKLSNAKNLRYVITGSSSFLCFETHAHTQTHTHTNTQTRNTHAFTHAQICTNTHKKDERG